MLYWICPECGHECSPAIRECPTCTAPPETSARNSTVQQTAPVQKPSPAQPSKTVQPSKTAQPSPISQELLSLAQNFQPAAVGLLAPAPQRKQLVAAKGAAVAVEEPEQLKEDLKEPSLSLDLASLGKLAFQPARPARSKPVQLNPTPVPAPVSSPAVASGSAPTLAVFRFSTAELTPAGEIGFQAAAGSAATTLEQPVEPLPSRRRSVAFLRAELRGAAHSGLATADFAGPLTQPDDVEPQNSQATNGVSAPLVFQGNGPALLASRLELAGASLAELLNALKASVEETERRGIQAIEASFRAQPTVGLLSAPADIVIAPAPPAEQWMRTEKPKFTGVAPEYTGHGRAKITPPQAPPLAGPSLPPQLLNLTQETAKLGAKHKRVTGWPLTLMIGTVVILGAVSLLQYVMQDRDSRTPTVAVTAQASTPAPASAAPAIPVLQEHPAARSVEVAGVRIVTGPNKRPQLQYLVINHSAKELTGLNIHIAVRSVEGLGGAPLFTVSSLVPTLGPNQSKEIRADLDASVKPASIPDWQSMRTEVLVARQ